jgi:hypothetical protein
MPWVRVDDAFYDHPKFVPLTAGAVGLWVIGLAYCNRNLTDGFIHRMAVVRLLPDAPDVTLGHADELIRAGLWSPADDGFAVVDYLDYQPSAEEIKGSRDKARERMAAARSARKFGGSSAEVRANTERTTSEVRVTPTPTPTPTPREERGARKRATPPPADFTVTDDMRAWARDKGLTDAAIDDETEGFLLFHRGKGSAFKDWRAAWQTWMRRARKDHAAPAASLPAWMKDPA